jgi:hypothetical protein
LNTALPESTGSTPAMVLISVDLPAPFTPSRPMRCSDCSESLTSFRTVFVGVTRRHVFEHEQRVRRAQRLAELEGERRGDVQRREVLHLRQHLHAALRLARLGRLGAEAVDERLQVRALARLLFNQMLSQRDGLRALHSKLE